MMLQDSIESSCPYCGERIELLVDGSVEEQTYIEDCQVCCRPIVICATTDEQGEVSIMVRSEDE
jgi:hypothetical protein